MFTDLYCAFHQNLVVAPKMEVDTVSKHDGDHNYSQSCNSASHAATVSNHEQHKTESPTTETECRENCDMSGDALRDKRVSTPTEPFSISKLKASVNNTNNYASAIENIGAVPETDTCSSVTKSHCSNTQPPLLTMSNSDIASHASQKHDCDSISSPLSAYDGLFSVEQHFVCLACCSCFQSDSALVFHLQVHITNMEIKLTVCSDATNDIPTVPDKIDKFLLGNTAKVGVFSKHNTKDSQTCQINTGSMVTNKVNGMDMSNKDNGNTVTIQSINGSPLSRNDVNTSSPVDKITRAPVGSVPGSIVPTPLYPICILPGCLVVQNAINPLFLATSSSNGGQNIQNKSNVNSSSHLKFSRVMTENCTRKKDSHDMNETKLDIIDFEANRRKQIFAIEIPDQNQPHLCEICGKVFVSRPTYFHHIKQMHSGKPYACDKCGKAFSLNYKLVQHIKKQCPAIFDKDTLSLQNKLKKDTKIRGEAMKCNLCMKVIYGPILLARHHRLCAMEKTIPCPVCGKLFAVQSQLRDHIKYHGERKYKCDLCPKSFLKQLYLETHKRRHAGERPYSCIQCGHRSFSKVELTNHMLIHSSDLLYSCSLCHKRFRHHCSLSAHMTSHTGERHLKCDICSREFMSMAKLKLHKKNKHNDKESKIFSCYNCCRIFSDSFHFKLHLKTHAPKNPYACHVCRLKCSTKNQLTQHTEIHTGDKSFTCTICRDSFFRKNDLVKHLETHSVQRTQCVVCKELLVMQDVVAHMETHDRRYSCDECGDRFHTQMILTEHLKIHFGDKPHICQICNLRFITYARLLTHLQSHSVTI